MTRYEQLELINNKRMEEKEKMEQIYIKKNKQEINRIDKKIEYLKNKDIITSNDKRIIEMLELQKKNIKVILEEKIRLKDEVTQVCYEVASRRSVKDIIDIIKGVE